MKTGNTKTLFTALITLLLSAFSYGQRYESMPAAVQSKMEQNKMEQKAKFDGIEVVFFVTLDHLEPASRQKLLSILEQDEKIEKINFSADGKLLELTCHVLTQIEEIDQHFTTANCGFIQYTTLYRLK